MSAVDFLRRWLGFAKPFLETVFSFEARLSEWWVSGAHHRLFLAQWGILPVPEFFDHKIGLYWMWRAKRLPHWVERGVFSLLALEQGCKVLELCCGDGYSRLVEVHAVGFTEEDNPIMRVWQISGGIANKEPIGWKLLRVDEATGAVVTHQKSLAPRPDYQAGDKEMQVITCQL